MKKSLNLTKLLKSITDIIYFSIAARECQDKPREKQRKKAERLSGYTTPP
jgi:predicted kinase